MNKSDEYVIAVDIGGTKLAIGIVNQAGHIIAQLRSPTEKDQGFAAVLKKMFSMTHDVMQKAHVKRSDILGIGIGCGGPHDLNKGLVKSPPNLPGWDDIPLPKLFSDEFQLPVTMHNDAVAAMLGEVKYGAGQGVDTIVYMTVSTGIGGGAIDKNHILGGYNGNAVEIGHMSVEANGRKCDCGSDGCLEAYASGTSIARRARERVMRDNNTLLLSLADGQIDRITAKTVTDAVRLGDAVAKEIWDETVYYLGVGVANVINLYNPQSIIIGGGVSAAGQLLFPPLRKVALKRAFPFLASVVDIIPAQLQQDVGVLGAAALAQLKTDSNAEQFILL